MHKSGDEYHSSPCKIVMHDTEWLRLLVLKCKVCLKSYRDFVQPVTDRATLSRILFVTALSRWAI